MTEWYISRAGGVFGGGGEWDGYLARSFFG